MNLTINKAKLHAEHLMQTGWQRLGNYLDVHPYYLRICNECVAVGQIIPIRSAATMTVDIERYFRKIMKRHERYGLTRVVFFSSPNGIPIPDFFRTFCEEEGIVIEFKNEININYENEN
jgi:hypothetical protein